MQKVVTAKGDSFEERYVTTITPKVLVNGAKNLLSNVSVFGKKGVGQTWLPYLWLSLTTLETLKVMLASKGNDHSAGLEVVFDKIMRESVRDSDIMRGVFSKTG